MHDIEINKSFRLLVSFDNGYTASRYIYINKRARKALGRSPEEKVKDYSGAIYRGPLMLSTKYWQRTSR